VNNTQIKTILTPIIGIIAAWLSRKIPFVDVTQWTVFIDTSITFIVAGVMGYFTKQTQLVSTVAAMPEVKEVKLEQSAPADLVAATPANVTK
jgi:hypothetical protein